MLQKYQLGSAPMKLDLASLYNSKVSIAKAQKASAEVALLDFQTKTESHLEQLKSEKKELESEKANILRDYHNLKVKTDALLKEKELRETRYEESEKRMSERLDNVVHACNAVETSLLDEVEQLRAESLENHRLLLELQHDKAENQAKITELNALLDSRSRRLNELTLHVDEKKAELEDYARLKKTSEDLRLQNDDLRHRLKLEEQRLVEPSGVRSNLKSTTQTLKLELEHERLKTAYKALNKQRAEWLITKEENNDLRQQVEQLKVWRQRALTAEDALEQMHDLNNSSQSLVASVAISPSRLYRLERENELLLAELGTWRSKANELQLKLDEATTRFQTVSGRDATENYVRLPKRPCSWAQAELAETPMQKMPCSEGISESELTIDLRRRITELETQLSSVESEKRALEEKIEALEMKGAYDPATTKVLTLRDNPFANTQENLFTEVTNLRQDNERFRQRIKVLEDCISRLRQFKSEQAQSAYVDEPTGGLGSVTMLVNDRLKDNPDPLTELAEVREQLRVEQSRSDRLMEMFHKASAKYRAYCRDLLGYRVDVSSSDECKIRSVFASDANEFILFRRNSDNALELKDNQYTRALPNEVRSFVEVQRNIPGFFAALTLSYLHQDTMLM